MRAVCAWCGADLGERPGPEGKVTHGVCASCKARELARVRDLFTPLSRPRTWARCTDGLGVQHAHVAEGWLTEPAGLRIQAMCRLHAEECIREYAEKLGESWTFAAEEAHEPA